ncbi:carboxyl-terminal-processing peptidase 1 chloroplastic [Phtheirospermum japonicum]|uniref:C-terminal processing peptidase n=1 Tax=Phtheirospermum japonicum TaxID=374723 RepID=A0A830C7H1_9LAMI|nr:carboxyl-terminal-processing peptidase 1 chloroplastic [Phtheirospermum japonicum]
MVTHLLCNSPPPLSPLPPPLRWPKSNSLTLPLKSLTAAPKPICSLKISSIAQALTSSLLSAALSLGLFYASPSDAISLELNTAQAELNCVEDEIYAEDRLPAQAVTNEEIVKEAWEIVNDSYLDTGRRRWSPDYWLKKKEDVMGSAIQARSRAHEIIRLFLFHGMCWLGRAQKFSKMARYDMTGIGINLREIPNDNGVIKLKVLGLILNGPAHLAGVRQVKHGNCGPVQSITVQRQSIAKSPVFYRLEQVKNGSGSVGYVRLKEFNALARKDLVIAMRRLQDMGASYFVLDLRDNLGGLVQAGIEIAKLFLEKGETVTYTVGRDPLSVKNIVADTSPLFSSPLIVLVNKNTASASEIVATALHDNCKAVLVGERTYGKGLIQSVFELNDGSGVVVTIGKYVTPTHMDINGNGIDPDFRNFPAWNDVTKYLSACHKPQEG